MYVCSLTRLTLLESLEEHGAVPCVDPHAHLREGGDGIIDPPLHYANGVTFAPVAFGHADRPGILRFQWALVIRVIRVGLNNNKRVLHNIYLTKKYTSNIAVLEGTPCTKSLNLVPYLMLRIRRQRQTKDWIQGILL